MAGGTPNPVEGGMAKPGLLVKLGLWVRYVGEVERRWSAKYLNGGGGEGGMGWKRRGREGEGGEGG